MPPWASRNLPTCLSAAPVKAPFSWPNRMLSTRLSGMAPQLTVTKGLERRSPAPWMARAMSSLPTPDSPSIEDRDLRGGGALAEADDPLHGRAAGDDVAEGEGAGGAPLHARDLAFQRAELQGVLDRDLQALGRGRLDDEIDRAGAHRADHRVDAAMGGLDDDRQLAVHLAQLGEHPMPSRSGMTRSRMISATWSPSAAGEAGERGLAAVGGDRRVWPMRSTAADSRRRWTGSSSTIRMVVDIRRRRAPCRVEVSLCGTIVVAAAAKSQWNQWSW